MNGAAAKPRVILDCDPGYDDAVAIMVASHDCELVGITTVSGNAPIDDTTRNALVVTELMGGRVPVYRGCAKPLIEPVHHAPRVHGPSGLDGPAPRIPEGREENGDAVRFLLEAADEDTWLIAVGPLTNVAVALMQDPDLARRLAGISVMGGGTSFGNVTPCAEFNVWADPEAAQVVFRSGARIRMCGLNLTHQLLTSEEITLRLRARPHVVCAFVADLLDYVHDRMGELRGERRAPLHDPCAVLAVTHPELFEWVPRHVEVELTGSLTRGMTVVDERSRRVAGIPNAEVGYRLDADRAMHRVLSSIRPLPPGP